MIFLCNSDDFALWTGSRQNFRKSTLRNIWMTPIRVGSEYFRFLNPTFIFIQFFPRSKFLRKVKLFTPTPPRYPEHIQTQTISNQTPHKTKNNIQN